MPDTKDPRKRDIGTVLHAVCERWLLADDQGRVPDPPPNQLCDQTPGHPVDPFPPHWDVVAERGRQDRLSPQDAAMVRKLFKDGVASGVLRRLPGREIEANMRRQVSPQALMRGRIDQRNRAIIEDHKSTGQAKYALSSAQLAEDPKMLCYAAEQFFTYPDLEELTLRLNYFCKDQRRMPNTWPVETIVTRAHVQKFWDEIVVKAVDEMLYWEEHAPTIDQWRSVEGPRVRGACEAYGGCQYARLCSGIERDDTMGIFDRRKVSEQAQDPAPPAPPAPAPPWAHAGCQACKGTGISSRGTPCAACDVVSGRLNGVTSSRYKTWIDDDGVFRWVEAEPAPTAAMETPPAEAKAIAEMTTEPPPKRKRGRPSKAEIAAREAAQIEPSVVDRPKDEAEIIDITCVTNTAGATSPRWRLFDSQGFVLCIDCIPDAPFTDLSSIVAKEGAELAQASGVDSMFQLDAFKRRDALASKAKEIARTLNGNVVCTDTSPDVRAFLAAIRPLAYLIIQGVR